jgi:hypothetical protein
MSGSPKNIKALIGELRDLNGRILSNNEQLYRDCRDVFEKLQELKLAKTSDIDVNHIEKTIKILEALPSETKEVEIEKLTSEEKEVESKLSEPELKKLVEDYEKAQNENEREVIEKKVRDEGGKKLVDQFEKVQKEIAQKKAQKIKDEEKREKVDSRENKKIEELIKEYKNAGSEKRKEIEKEIYLKTGEKDADKYIQKVEEVVARNENNLKKVNEEIKEKVVSDLIKASQDQGEEITKIIEDSSLKDKVDQKELEKEVRKEVKKSVKDPEKIEETVQDTIQKVEEIRAEIKIDNKAEEIANKAYQDLKNENVPVSDKVKKEIKEAVLKSWKDGDRVEIPSELEGKHQEIVEAEIKVSADKFKNENLEDVFNYRAEELRKEVSYELRKEGISDENLINEYVNVTNELTNNPLSAREEVNNTDVVNFLEGEQKTGQKFLVQPENAVEEAKFIAKNVTLAPKKFNRLIDRYNRIRERIGSDKLPKLNKIKGIRVLEKMSNVFKEGSQARNWINGAQKMVGFLEKANSFTGNLLAKIGVEKLGLKVLGKIGGQAAVEFVKQASLVIAKEGTLQGIKSIAMGIMGKGAVTAAAGGGAAAGGALASAVAAFQALPVVGQIIAVVVGAIILIKGAIDGIKGVLGKITGLNMNGVKNFVANDLGLGGFVGGVVQFGADVATFLIGIPTFLITVGIVQVLTPVIIFFFLGTFAFSLFQQKMVSTLVPPADYGNCVLKEDYGGEVNCNQNAPENAIAVDKANFVRIANDWTEGGGKNFASECFNDTVNRALCNGINPVYALWTWLHESGASNYKTNDVEDFGIHYIPQNTDFNSQITEFVKLTEVGKRCLSDPRIGGDFWLAWAANYLNGNDCNPDRPNSIFKDMTPRIYAAEIREQWGWISTSAMPNGITVPKGGKDCDQINNYSNDSSTHSGNSKEVTINGKVYICTETSQSSGGTDIDPNAPGIDGVEVEGECSVGGVVVPTKQCDPQWGQTQLAGGSCSNGKAGTICSAGCGPTSVSMLLRHVNGSMTPNNVIFSPNSAYRNMGCEGSSLDQAQIELFREFGTAAVTYDATTQGCDEKAIAKWICSGKVVMVLADFYRNSKLEIGGHYVLAIGVKDGKIVVQDPYYDVTKTPFEGKKAYGYAASHPRGCLLVDKAAVK